ncbi:MAG TPA: hypothetical protein PL182_12275 [Pseudobdellovibrionaceae bacterium]|nr:hypothetical protein [Pseudobdellovibrionaceae bacterium]
MTRSLLIGLLIVSAAQAASAASFVFRGKIVSREICKDEGLFSQSRCKRADLGKNRECLVTVKTDSRENLNAIQIASPAWVEAGDHRRTALNGRLDRPYLYKDDFVAYNTKIDRDTSAEVKVSGNRVLGVYVFTKHVHGKNSRGEETRAFNQYFCANLQPSKRIN